MYTKDHFWGYGRSQIFANCHRRRLLFVFCRLLNRSTFCATSKLVHFILESGETFIISATPKALGACWKYSGTTRNSSLECLNPSRKWAVRFLSHSTILRSFTSANINIGSKVSALSDSYVVTRHFDGNKIFSLGHLGRPSNICLERLLKGDEAEIPSTTNEAGSKNEGR